MSVHNPKKYTEKLLQLIKEFIKAAGNKINVQKSIMFLYILAKHYPKIKLRK